jgi:hypothetical protein
LSSATKSQAQFRPFVLVVVFVCAAISSAMGVVSSTKRVATCDASPLDNAGILLHVFNILVPGHYLFISAVSKAWRDSYGRVASVRMAGLNHQYTNQAVLHTTHRILQ